MSSLDKIYPSGLKEDLQTIRQMTNIGWSEKADISFQLK